MTTLGLRPEEPVPKNSTFSGLPELKCNACTNIFKKEGNGYKKYLSCKDL